MLGRKDASLNCVLTPVYAVLHIMHTIIRMKQICSYYIQIIPKFVCPLHVMRMLVHEGHGSNCAMPVLNNIYRPITTYFHFLPEYIHVKGLLKLGRFNVCSAFPSQLRTFRHMTQKIPNSIQLLSKFDCWKLDC